MDIQFYSYSIVYCIANIKYDMTDIERERVENSAWIVRAVVNRLRPNDEDLGQSIYLYLCKCSQRYDENRGVKWATYAFKNAYYFGMMWLKREKRYILDELCEDVMSCEDIQGDLENREELDYFIAKLDERQRHILCLKYEGYKNNEIKQLLGMGKKSYFNEVKKIHQVAKQNNNLI